MGNIPPVEPPDLRNRRGRSEEEDDYNNYPPSGANYPPPPRPSANPNVQYPPPSANYPPPGATYPPQPAGPINLDDPGYGQPTHPPQSYPPPSANYPPPGATYPPQPAGPINLDDPGYGQPAHPPRPPDSYPPSGGGYPPQPTGPISLDDPGYGQPARTSDYPQRIDLGGLDYDGPSDDPDTPNLRRGRSRKRDETPQESRLDRPYSGGGLSERQVEYLAWGSTVLLLGISLIQVIAGSASFLRFFFPLAAGAILMGSSLYQRVVRGWHVGPLTWLISILLISYTITLMIAGSDTNVFKWIAYFTGTLVIMTGVILLLQVFRQH